MKKLKLVKAISASMLVLGAGAIQAETVEVELNAVETELEIDNQGNTQTMWTYNGSIPGPMIRVTEGDTIDFTLHNVPENEQSHSIDFHAAVVDVLDEFAPIPPGETKEFTFEAKHPGLYIYHCGADSMAEHISRGLYGAIIVDPEEGYSEQFPEPDREYVLVQGDLFEDGTSAENRAMGNGWQNAMINGKVFHYDPVHDTNASVALEAEPGERVRVYFVNAMINEAAAFHPIAGIWERVWDNGNPKNVLHEMQTVEVPPAHGMIFDIVPPADRPTNNALVDHRMKHALNGAISVLMTFEGADPDKGRGDLLILE